MFEEAYIIEDTKSDIDDLIESLSIFIKKDNIYAIENLDDALNTISNSQCDRSQIVAFIDILWHGRKTGINLASSIRKKHPAIKLVAYTRTGEGSRIDDFFGKFDFFQETFCQKDSPPPVFGGVFCKWLPTL